MYLDNKTTLKDNRVYWKYMKLLGVNKKDV